MLVIAGSASTQAMSPVASAASSASTSFHSTATVVTRVDGRADVVGPRHRVAVLRDREGLVDRAVVAPGVDEDLGPAGHGPRQPDREPVGVGGGERELPVGEAEAALELRRHPGRVLGRQHQRDPRDACSAIAATVAAGEWPVIAPVSPRQRSTYSLPSTSLTWAPSASAANTGVAPPTRSSTASARPRAAIPSPRSKSSPERRWVRRTALPRRAAARAACRGRSRRPTSANPSRATTRSARGDPAASPTGRAPRPSGNGRR